jgi:hypothetical protein
MEKQHETPQSGPLGGTWDTSVVNARLHATQKADSQRAQKEPSFRISDHVVAPYLEHQRGLTWHL